MSANGSNHFTAYRIIYMIFDSGTKMSGRLPHVKGTALTGHEVDYPLGITIGMKFGNKRFPIRKHQAGTYIDPGTRVTFATSGHAVIELSGIRINGVMTRCQLIVQGPCSSKYNFWSGTNVFFKNGDLLKCWPVVC